MRKVLLISYYFPPLGGSPAQRILKFTKYLPEFGWEPIVLTVRRPVGEIRDESLMAQIPPELKVYRAPCWGTTQALFERREPHSALQRARDWILRLYGYLLVPDPMVGWVIPAIRESKRIFQIHPDIEVILTSSPPPSVNLIGRMLRQYSSRPWVADFRDAWMSIPDRDQRRLKIRMRDTFEIWLEHLCARHFDYLISVNQPIVDDWIARYPCLCERTSVITNGFDPDDFEDVKDIQNTKFTMVYTGTFLSGRDPMPFLQALHSLLDDWPSLRQQIQVLFVGDDSARARIDVITQLNLGNTVRVLPYLPRREALAYQKGADVLLLFGTLPTGDPQRDRQNLTGKIFEYMASGRPILAMAPDSVATDLVRELQLGMTVPSTDVPKIRQALELLLKQAQEGRLGVKLEPARLSSFYREELTRQLAHILDVVSARKSSARIHPDCLRTSIWSRGEEGS